MGKYSKQDIGQVLHAAGAARGRGHSNQAHILLSLALDLCKLNGFKVEELQWYAYALAPV